MVSMRNSCKKPVRYMWNPMNHCWQEMTSENDVRNIINTIYLQISTFVKSNSVSNEFLKNLKLSLLVSSILSETNNERRVVEMDRHKWFIRTREGILDILTGHVGATVPEFFISDRQLGVEFGKTLLESFRVDPDHIALYRLLTQRKFFRKFQIHLYEDLTDDVYDTLQETVWRELPNKNDPIHDSMLHCFTHLCKYLSFEYDRLMYMLDVLSSLLVATNYARKFFIFKGVTRNGKSKFFQMIARVFGSYSHTIRNVNLQPSTGCNQVAQPELAMTMFTCRIVTVEEMSGKLNENLVKEITGNSTTSFRNLFEQHTGGIPSAKIFASANTIPICTASEAFKDRVVVFPFETTFTKEASSMPTSEQVRLDEFPLDTSDSVIEDSYKGFFLLLYLHMILHINKKNGTVTYGREPDSLLEYKEEFLTPTDIYTQFKIYADVQLAPGHCTTLTDLKSAIRQFLKTIKNTSIEETEIVLKFDDEFKDYRRCEPQLMNSFLFEAEDDIPISFQRDDEDVDEEVSQKKRSLEEDEEAGPSQKKQKLEEEEEVSQKKRKIMDEEAGPSQKKQKLGQEEEVRPSQKKRKIMDNLEEEQSGVSKKKRKLNRLEIGAPQRSIVYYHNVLIKNLKKEKMRYS